MTIYAGTGHRPEKIERAEVIRAVSEFFDNELLTQRPLRFITGMAAGYDLWAAAVAIDLGIPVWAAKPWRGHRPRKADKALYDFVIENAERVIDVNPSMIYLHAGMYQKRNEWMVDNADEVLAYWDGTPGGTANCVAYAERVKKPVTNLYE